MGVNAWCGVKPGGERWAIKLLWDSVHVPSHDSIWDSATRVSGLSRQTQMPSVGSDKLHSEEYKNINKKNPTKHCHWIHMHEPKTNGFVGMATINVRACSCMHVNATWMLHIRWNCVCINVCLWCFDVFFSSKLCSTQTVIHQDKTINPT